MRLDNYLVLKGYFDSRNKSKQAIERGEIFINGKAVNKCSYDIDECDEVEIDWVYKENFVSLGGFKLSKALKNFNLDVNDMACADLGASTGGFTDCLLQNGAKKVYAVDLNDVLLHNTLRSDERVKMLVKNVKDLDKSCFYEPLDLVVADLSFISVTMALPVISSLVDDKKDVVILIKPQFETGAKKKFKNGIIKDKKLQLEICNTVYDFSISCNLIPQAITTAPITEGKNVEFLMWLKKGGEIKLQKKDINF